MARSYRRDSRGRFAGGGGGGGSARPAAKPAPRGTNRLTRDNSGRITSQGGNGATARGGRLKTASGKLRATQTAKIKGGGGMLRGGKSKPAPAVVGKIDAGKAAAKASQLRAKAAQLEQRGNALMSGGRRDGAYVNVSLASRSRQNEISAGFRGLEMSRQAATLRSRANTIEQRAAQSAAKAAREAAKPKRVRTPESLRMSRAKQIEKRRGMSRNPAGDWFTRPASTDKMADNAQRTQERALAFYGAARRRR